MPIEEKIDIVVETKRKKKHNLSSVASHKS
jgi:hypothetical protein